MKCYLGADDKLSETRPENARGEGEVRGAGVDGIKLATMLISPSIRESNPIQG